MRTAIGRLMNAVDVLATPHREMAWIHDTDTQGLTQLYIMRRPLLEELDDVEGQRSPGVGGSQPGGSVLVNPEVHDLREDIRKAINADLRRLGYRRTIDRLPALLLLWLRVYMGAGATQGEVQAWVVQMQDWENRARGIVEPRRVREVAEACPRCRRATMRVDGVERKILSVTYREDDLHGSTKLECLRCGVIAAGADTVDAALDEAAARMVA